MRSLAGLNPKQAEAVQFVKHHLLVVAGAGSGKTRVLTHKIAHLIEDLSVPPSQILAMTFSNKAANEMKERVRLLLPSYEQPQWVGTFHSICLKLLKEFYLEAELSPYFTIYDETDQLSVIKKALTELKFDPKRLPPKVIRHHISRAKNETDEVLDYLQEQGELGDRAMQVVERYEETLAQNQALDFGDLLIRTYRLLRQNSHVANRLYQRWTRILIDEYQDTNQIQKDLIKGLAGTTGIVCAVGDEDQSIYAWRGARVENILEFPSDFPGASTIKMEQNYRSTQCILQAANFVIQNNIGRRDKTLWTQNNEGTAVSFFYADDDYQESQFVLDRIEEILRQGEISAKEVAIFYRTHVQSRLFEEECRRRNQPYRVFGGLKFYDRAEIKDTLAFLKLALNPSDNISFLRIINTPARGIGKQSLLRLADYAASKNLSMLEAIPEFSGKGKAEKALKEFRAWFLECQKRIPDVAPEKAAELFLEKSEYMKALENEGTIEAYSRLENIEELLRSMQEFSEQTGENLHAYLDRISLVSDMDQYNAEDEALALMTLHNSKGLEFDVVFLVGMEEGIFPHQLSIAEDDPDEIEEERRLCYVGMTRAKKNLLLTASQRRRLYRTTQFNPVSRFVSEIPPEHLLHLQDVDLSMNQTPRPRKSFGRKNMEYDEYRQESYDEDEPLRNVWAKAYKQASLEAPYSPGMKILHPDFGIGTIRKCEGQPDNVKLTIKFQQRGVKKISLNYCEIEVIER